MAGAETSSSLEKLGICRTLNRKKETLRLIRLHLFIWETLLSKATYNRADELMVKRLPRPLNLE